MAEAFRNIKQEFGPDAVILSARSLSNENMAVDETISSRVEVMAATDNFIVHKKDDAVIKHHLYSKYKDEKHIEKDQRNDKKTGLFNTISEKFDPLKNIRFLRNKSSQTLSSNDDKKNEIKERLLNHGVDGDIVEDVSNTIEGIVRSKKSGQFEDIRSLLIETLKRIGVDFFPEEVKYPKKKTISLIGLTGVGKTTTLVKLIASEMLKNDREIGVISLDTHRVGSNALLHVYSKIMGFELTCIKDLKEIKTAQKDLKDKQIIFIDTPGVSLNNQKLNRYIKEALDKIQPDEIHLLMHANIKKSDAEKIIQGFEMFKFNRLLFTKLDETMAYGTLINQLLFSEKHASYITFGQNIPEDVQSVDFELLADLFLNSRSIDDFSNIFGSRRNKSIFQNGLSGISHN